MKVVLVGAAVAAALATAAVSVGAAPPLIVAKALAVGTVQSGRSVEATSGTMILDSLTIAPGATTGWHKHGSAVAVVVTSGTLTLLDPAVRDCAPVTVSKGQAFVEAANHVHVARNDGRTPVKLYAMYLGLPKNAQPNSPATAPANCNG
jgi:quercetin dioxygenase-like cupin family protein